MQQRTKAKITTLCAALLLTSGCTAAFLDIARHDIFVKDDVRLIERNYAAADYLIQQAGGYIGKYAVIRAEPLADINQPGMESTFGKLLPEHVGVRLSQLGYQVDLESVIVSPEVNYLKPGEDYKRKAGFILSGSYRRDQTDMNISLRLIDAKNKQVVGVYDYRLPLTREINELARPIPQIMRIEQP